MCHLDVTQQIADSAGETLTIHMPTDSGQAARVFRAWYERLQAIAPVGTAVIMTFTVPPYWDDRLPAYNAANLRLTWEPHDGEGGLVYVAMDADGAFEATVRQIGPQTWAAEVVEVGADSINCRTEWRDYALAASWAEGEVLRRSQGGGQTAAPQPVSALLGRLMAARPDFLQLSAHGTTDMLTIERGAVRVTLQRDFGILSGQRTVAAAGDRQLDPVITLTDDDAALAWLIAALESAGMEN